MTPTSLFHVMPQLSTLARLPPSHAPSQSAIDSEKEKRNLCNGVWGIEGKRVWGVRRVVNSVYTAVKELLTAISFHLHRIALSTLMSPNHYLPPLHRIEVASIKHPQASTTMLRRARLRTTQQLARKEISARARYSRQSYEKGTFADNLCLQELREGGIYEIGIEMVWCKKWR